MTRLLGRADSPRGRTRPFRSFKSKISDGSAGIRVELVCCHFTRGQDLAGHSERGCVPLPNTIILLTAAWFFCVGSAMGSFYNVLADRLPNGRDIVRTRSECTACHTWLCWYDLIPLCSFLLLRGKCRYCGQKLSLQYPLSELAVGGLFLFAFLRYNGGGWNMPQLVTDLALWSMLFVVAVMDYKHGIVIDQILAAFSSIGLAARLWSGDGAAEPFLGAAVGFALYGLVYLCARLAYKKEGFGQGDILLLAAVGVFLGPVQTLITGVLAFYCSLLFILFWTLRERRVPRGRALPFGPSVCLAAFVVSIWGAQITDWLTRVLGFSS